MIYYYTALLQQVLSPVLGADPVGPAAPAAPAAADAAGGTVQAAGEQTVSAVGGLFGGAGIWVVYAVILVGMYFLLMRPQRKREKQMKEMQAGIRVGDNVVTNGGLYGRVADLGEDSFIVEFGTNRSIKIPVRKTDVLGVKEPKLTPPPKIE